VTTLLVSWGHLLIGLSLLAGLLVRVSSLFGVALMILYWMAHMDFPYISDTNNFLGGRACRQRIGTCSVDSYAGGSSLGLGRLGSETAQRHGQPVAQMGDCLIRKLTHSHPAISVS
jgi:thiosulfate dehydrogenase [quinone] large subunit